MIEFFKLEVTNRSTADLLDIQANSSILFHHKLRQVIAYHLAIESDEIFKGKIELDESYSGGRRNGKRDRRASGKVAVFGILKRRCKAFTVVVAMMRLMSVNFIIKK